MPPEPTTEHLRLAILAAAQEGDLELLHRLTMAYNKFLGREEGEHRTKDEAPVAKHAKGLA
ncbi:MAG: hypothetical protein K0S06_3907 [Microvirga sp.]|jgi:hypothetical protein|nr:hypothetical protein [Microvirga sp.]